MKLIGLTGPPGSGKTTLLAALAGVEQAGEIATLDVHDERLNTLAELEGCPRRVPVRLQVTDVHAAARTAGAAFSRLREADAVLVVVAAFGGQDPSALLDNAVEDLIIADMPPLETRLGRAGKDPAAKDEIPALERALSILSEGRRLSDEPWEAAELKTLSPLTPITLKPIVAVFNVDDAGGPLPETNLPAFGVNAALEKEAAGIDREEAAELLEAYGVTEAALTKLVAETYRLFDLVTFFTLGKECRAWEVPSGTTAPQAAGRVHSDMQRGFIRAEVVSFEQVAGAGGWREVKAAGGVRVEGKDYVIAEGDVVHFRFAV